MLLEQVPRDEQALDLARAFVNPECSNVAVERFDRHSARHAEAGALARQLASGPVQAHYMTKRQLDAEWAVSIETALDMEAEAQAECMTTNDFKRAYEAFAAKKRPEFKGD